MPVGVKNLRLTAIIAVALGLLNFAFSGQAFAERVFVDSAGRKVVLPDTVTRVVAAGPPGSVLIYCLAPEKMVGWVREPTAAEKVYLLPAVRDLAAYGRLTGKGNTANIETILKLKPDLIIDVGSVDATYASLADRVQQQTGIPYVLIDGSFAKTPNTLRTVGDILGVQERAEILAAYADSVLARAEEIVAKSSTEQRPKVYLARGPAGLETGLAGSINSEIIEAAGGVNVASGSGKGGLTNVSLEQIIVWDPDFIITQDQEFFDTILNDSSWSAIAAVKTARIYRAPTSPFGWIDGPPGVNRLIGLTWLVDIFDAGDTRKDLRSEVREFYRLFYQSDVNDLQLDQLVGKVP